MNLGIDLGTTYSSLSIFNPQTDEAELVIEGGTTSSFASYINIVYAKKQGLSCYFGPEAKGKGGSFALFDSKRLIGKTFTEYEEMGTEKEHFSFDVQKDEYDFCKMVIQNPMDKTKTEEFYPEEVSGMILWNLIKIAKAKYPDLEIGKTVVTVPVKFTPMQRSATIRACKLAGLFDVELVHEPSASIFAYKQHIEHKSKKEDKNTGEKRYELKEGTKILVIDFGGGTFDVCTCTVGTKPNGETNIEVIQTGGDQDLGGKHFDEEIYNIIEEKIEEDYGDAINLLRISRKDTPKQKELKKKRKWKAIIQAEKAKRALTTEDTASIALDTILGEDYEGDSIQITRHEFEEKCVSSGLLRKFEGSIDLVLHNSNLSREQIDLVLPIGGSCCIPIVKNTINKMFPDMNKRADPLFDSLSAVSKGAAYYASSLERNDTEYCDLEERIPYSVGVAMLLGIMNYQIPKGSKLPVSNTETYCILFDGQPNVCFPLFIGEELFAFGERMKYIKKLTIPLPENVRANDFIMSATMSIDRSGMIKFQVKKIKDDEFLGEMEYQLEMNALDSKLKEMHHHIFQFLEPGKEHPTPSTSHTSVSPP